MLHIISGTIYIDSHVLFNFNYSGTNGKFNAAELCIFYSWVYGNLHLSCRVDDIQKQAFVQSSIILRQSLLKWIYFWKKSKALWSLKTHYFLNQNAV